MFEKLKNNKFLNHKNLFRISDIEKIKTMNNKYFSLDINMDA